MPAYDGNEPFVFVSYSHADSELVFKELSFLREAGVNIWYDEGITPGSRWSDELASAIERADLFLALLTRSAVASENCLNEIDFALRRQKPFLAVELEPVELPAGIELNIGNRQSILKHRFNEADYQSRLIDAVQRTGRFQATLRGSRGPHAPPITAKSRFPVWTAAMVAICLVAVCLGLYYGFKTDQSREMQTIAVLPFQNMSADPGNEYLADGLADELITTLGSFGELSVSSRTSSFYYKNQIPQMQDIRERLGVEHAIEGSVRLEQSGLIINVSLFETSQGKQVWARRFATSLANINTVSSEIALAVTTQIGLKLDPADKRLAQSATITPAAYDAFLKGVDYLNRPPTPEVLSAAKIHFETALSVEPGFVRASAGLCDTHLAVYRMARTEDVEVHYENAKAQCNETLRLDTTSYSGHQSLANLYRHSGRYEEALGEIRLADTLQPATASVQYEYGKILGLLNQNDQAELRIRKGIALDPGFWGGYADLGDFLYLLGRYSEALGQFEKVQQLVPDSGLNLISLGATHYMLDDPVTAHASWKRAITENPASESRAYWQAATWLGINSLNQSCPVEAAYWQQQAISVSPNDHRLWGRLAEACQLQQTKTSEPLTVARDLYQRAIALAESELEDNPNDWESLGLLALYRARNSAPGPSQELINRMLALQPGNPDAIEIALFFAEEVDDGQSKKSLTSRLLELNYPVRLLERNPSLSGLRACEVQSDQKERLICSQGTIIPALLN